MAGRCSKNAFVKEGAISKRDSINILGGTCQLKVEWKLV